MEAVIIDGNVVADKLNEETAAEIKRLKIKPRLAVFLVGDDPRSLSYIKKKREACGRVGIDSELYQYPDTVSQSHLEEAIRNSEADAILVQLPLPINLNKWQILNSIPAHKDVDCFSDVNIGKMAQGIGELRPCTPSGICELLKHYKIDTEGANVTIINRSQVVGQPLSIMLAQEPYNATVHVCHEYTWNIDEILSKSDIIISAVGKYPLFQLYPDWCYGAEAVIDVAMNSVDGKIFGDVIDVENMKQSVKFLTKTPGGCGPVTVSSLMRNTLICKKLAKYNEMG